MTRLHVTYPNGETAEATYRASLPELLEQYDNFLGCDCGPPCDSECAGPDDEWDADTLVDHGGEG